MSRTARILKLGFVFVLGAFIAVGVAVALWLPGRVRAFVIDEAAARGIDLRPGEISFSWGSVRIGTSEFRLRGVRSLGGTVAHIEVHLDGFEPKNVEARGVKLDAVGSAPFIALEVTEWAKRYPRAFRLPTRASAIDGTWRPARDGEAWLRVSGGALEPSASGAVFRADQTSVLGASLGKLGAAWTADDAVVALGFGEDDPSRAPVRIEVKHNLEKPTAHIELSPTPVEKLAGPMGMKLPIENVTVSGTVNLTFASRREDGPIAGAVAVALKGYVPPHPRELDGFVFGDTTTFESNLAIDQKKERVTLSGARVTAGAFKLKGGGQVVRHATHATLLLDLTGHLPCDALAGAAAESHLGQALGKLLGAVAKQTLKGTVGVKVKIEADSRDLSAAKVMRTIGVGCGLKPLEIPGFGKLELPPGLLPAPGEIPPLPSGLPPLPSGLPPFPALPKIDVQPAPKPAPPAKPQPAPSPKPATS